MKERLFFQKKKKKKYWAYTNCAIYGKITFTQIKLRIKISQAKKNDSQKNVLYGAISSNVYFLGKRIANIKLQGAETKPFLSFQTNFGKSYFFFSIKFMTL